VIILALLSGSGCGDDSPASPDAMRLPCDLVEQTGCESGQKCAAAYGDDGRLTRRVCVPDGSAEVGQACSIVDAASGVDDCVTGAHCVEGVCRALCAPPGNSEANISCRPNLCESLGAIAIDRPIISVSRVGGCFEPCDLELQDCDGGDGCYLRLAVVRPETVCLPVVDDAIGRLQDAECLPWPASACFTNGCDLGYSPYLPENNVESFPRRVCAFLCSPSATDLGGDPSGITCSFTSPDRPDGPGGAHECRFIQTFGVPEPQIPPTLGFCVDPATWGSCADATGDPDTDPPGCAPIP